MKKYFILVVCVCLFGLLTSCQSNSNYRNSSVVDYLYPNSENQQVSSEIPRLTLPLRVGIAFTPSGFVAREGLHEGKKLELMSSISEHFKTYDFVKSIEVIPSDYLRPQGSFDNLDQLKRMFNIDVIALISYDQTNYTDEGFASIAYWTIIGAYIIPAEKNATHTMLDAVLYDIDSRKLLFRAPGRSSVESNSTLVGLEEQTREDAVSGFEQASVSLRDNLKLQLELFRKRVKETPEEYQIVKSEGYRGGGSSYWFMFLLAGAIALSKFRK
jgi:rhombotail lipoprotein